MPTRRLPAGAADVRRALLATGLLVGAAACETPEVVVPPPPEPVPEPAVVELEPEPSAPPRGGLIVRMHAASDADMPEGAVATVTLEGSGGRHSAELQKGQRLVRLDGLDIGRYDLRVTVGSRGVEIGAFSYFVDVVERAVGDVTVQVDYLRADLVVEATVESSSERRYAGTAASAADTCPGTAPDEPVPADLRLATDGELFEVTLERFQQDTLRLSGRSGDAAGPGVAAGTFESSAGPVGTWRLTHVTAPTPGAIAAVLEVDDQTRMCQSRWEYAGLLEEGPSAAAHGPRYAGPAVEVVGHGQKHTVKLARGASVATFSGLLVGPYDVFVGFASGEGVADSRRQSVLLTADGARVATTFQREWAPPPAPPLAASVDHTPPGGTYHGKSVVASGRAACTGSIALVDTTKLAFSARGRELTMTFDSFYGQVLKLTGELGDAGAFAAGTYRSADGKRGSWRIDHLAAPTARSLATLVEFSNETDACQATYEFAGAR